MLPSNMFTVANVGSMMHLSEESLEDVEVKIMQYYTVLLLCGLL